MGDGDVGAVPSEAAAEEAGPPAPARFKARPTRAAPRRAAKRKRRAPARWSAKREVLFLDALAESSNVAWSLRQAGLAETTVYRRRARYAEFAAKWNAALREGYLKLESEMLSRALAGVDKPVWHGGKQVGTIREYNDRTALALLNAHRASVTGTREVQATISIEELRVRLKARLGEMNRRLGGEGYDTDRDLRGCVLRFRWQATGVKPLDAIDGPTLTIEGRDAAGTPRAWYVRLWNYAEGSPDDALVTIDFEALDGGFLLPGEADPVWAGDVDRLFVSLVAPDYSGAAAALGAPADAHVALTDIACDGPRSVLAIGEAMVPAHGLRIATGYDDCYNLTPARVLRNMLHLGYRGPIDHYVGMSHYFRLEANGGSFYASLAGGVLNVACAAWHAAFAREAAMLGYEPIVSLSYELLDQHCWGDWKQRAHDGTPAQTGWVPPSTLLSPAHPGAMAYLRAVAVAFVDIVRDAGLPVRFQIGEPWWWVTPTGAGVGAPCLYDAAAVAAFGGAPPAIGDVRAALDPAQTALLDAAGVLLAASTARLRDAVRAAAPDAEVLLLAYLPSVLDPQAPEIRRANLPLGWAHPAYDVLQLEDYDWAIAGDTGATARGIATATARLGYAPAETHYFAGFVPDPADAAGWRPIAEAAAAARTRGHAETFLWALPQVLRDGFVHFDLGDDAVDAFDDVDFPIAIGRAASVTPGFSTAVVTSASGAEQRNVDWAQARLRFDAGPGVRSAADIQTLLAFFRARRGQARAFRFRDPLDDSSNAMTDPPGFADIALGTGDGVRTAFPLVKYYGTAQAEARRITRPVAGSVRVGVGGGERLTGWTLAAGGIVQFAVAPAGGAAVTAGFRFDVPVRFADDTLEVSVAAVTAGDAPQVALIEVREG